MATSTVENYLKRLYQEAHAYPGTIVPMGRLAAIMGVVPGTATAMVKALADSGLVQYSPRNGVQLTAAGNQLALHVLRRHRLVELFLVRIVGLDWSEVHAEAEELEHVISDKLLERIDLLLEHPTADPHGDPIPTSAGEVAASQGVSLAVCEPGTVLEVLRIVDQERAFLQFAAQSGLTPGTRWRVRERHPEAEALLIAREGGEVGSSGMPLVLSLAAAAKFIVRPMGESRHA